MQIRRRRAVSVYANNKSFVSSLEFVQLRVVMVMIGFAVLVISVLVRLMLAYYNHDVIEYSVKRFVSSFGDDTQDYLRDLRRHLIVELMVVETYFWSIFLVVLLLFMCSYKDVRDFWLLLLTCGIYPNSQIAVTVNSTSVQHLKSNGICHTSRTALTEETTRV